MCKVQLKNARLRPFALFMALFLMNVSWAFAQLTVTGNAQSTSGEPLIGVNVVEKGTTNGTVTDLDGNYTLRVAKGKTLVFSYIGFLSQEVVVNGAKVNVTLKEDTETLDEVVVIGYGSMARKDVTSSITTVKADQLNVGVFSDAASMLQGKVAGLTITTTGDPNGSPSITLRGSSSLRTGQAMQPYYVIDGIPGVDISIVAPDDIESIDVLRDATATAIYGSKAANGVIIINTKKGKHGAERTNVSYSGYVAFDNILNTLDMASADDLRAYAEATGATLANDMGANTNWQDEVLRTAISTNHNLSINGGAGKTTYMASINYQDREGVITGSSMDRLNVRSLVTTKVLKDRLELSAGVNAKYGKAIGVPMNNEGASVLDAMNYFSPMLPVRNEDGSWTTGSGSKNYNPLSLIYENTSETMYKNTQLLGKASLEIIEGLKWNVNYSFTNNQSTYSAYDSHNTQLEGISAYNGRATRNTYFGHEHIFETFGNYDTTINDIHKLSVMAGYSWEEKMSNDGFGLTVHDFYDDVLKWNQLTYASTIDGIPAVQSGTKETIRNISFYGRASYSFNSKYMIQATVRRDGSSVFGKNNQWGTFPSVSVAWNITEENFMKNQNLFDNLKFRLGYGVSGNALGFGAYTAIATYGASGFFNYNGKQWRTLAATKNANPDLKWETTGMFNVGLDYGLLNGRLSGTIEFYNKKTKDLIWNYPVSTNLYPFGDIAANVGEITNQGIEISINAVPVQTKNFTWNTTVTLSHNKNTVNRLSNDKFEVGVFTQGDPMVAGVSSEGYTQRIIEGEPLGTFFTYEFAGFNDAGKATYYVRDENTGERTGETTEQPGYKDRTITGCAQPKLNFGWNNTFNYKNWNATVFFTGVFGNDIYNGTRANYMSPEMLAGGKNVLKEFLDNPTTSASLPSDRFIENGSYLRLSTLSLGYTFKNFNGWLQNLQLYVTCNNLFTITGYKGLDPEVNMGGIDPGIDYRWSVYPHTRTTMVGVKINF
ncbi:TonB-dependent receptor [Phocaeicola plebeius]|jgi:TonB-linked SusC/RagA family outer membrane protein|uniref:TonB-dependent receptor n=1 Tax=Phocaeicola plebeius TaxID=310297 RepID=A0A3E4Z595_9BACT|nr:TonB-dependent receptor [Phocaeicola plebeius]RGM87426.1 TonB-dependent receptor [Phocaeicola plebeius]RHK98662.1 TonB-dependent receptor [Phocaeicola plebeius]RHL17237.1 TonB-dependent receptor [Phocaeicola plebeius]